MAARSWNSEIEETVVQEWHRPLMVRGQTIESKESLKIDSPHLRPENSTISLKILDEIFRSKITSF